MIDPDEEKVAFTNATDPMRAFAHWGRCTFNVQNIPGEKLGQMLFPALSAFLSGVHWATLQDKEKLKPLLAQLQKDGPPDSDDLVTLIQSLK